MGMNGGNDPRNICILCEVWGTGGIESFLSSVLTAMDLQNMRITIVASSITKGDYWKKLTEAGIRFRQLSGNHRLYLRNFYLFHRLLREERFDVVHLNAFNACQLFYLQLAKWQGIPMRIAHSHNTMIRKGNYHLLKSFLHRIARTSLQRCATLKWACSEEAAEFLFTDKTIKASKYSIIRNGFEVSRFCYDACARKRIRAYYGIEGKYVIGNAGRLCIQKNQHFLIDILACVKKKHQVNCVLLLLGEGPDGEALKEYADALNVSKEVIFAGFKGNAQSYYSAMDVFVFPSLFEGLGIVALEAQVSGLSTICSENVPDDVFVTDLITRMSLDCGPEKWAEVVLNNQRSSCRRVSHEEELRNAGYDSCQVAHYIRQYYTLERHKEVGR